MLYSYIASRHDKVSTGNEATVFPQITSKENLLISSYSEISICKSIPLICLLIRDKNLKHDIVKYFLLLYLMLHVQNNYKCS